MHGYIRNGCAVLPAIAYFIVKTNYKFITKKCKCSDYEESNLKKNTADIQKRANPIEITNNSAINFAALNK